MRGNRWLAAPVMAAVAFGVMVALPPLVASEPRTGGGASTSDRGEIVKRPDASLALARAGARYSAIESPATLGILQAGSARQELADWVDTMLDVYPYVAAYGPNGMQETLERLSGEIPTMTDEEIAAIKTDLGSHPGFWEFPQFVLSLFDSGEAMPLFYRTQFQAWRRAEEARIAARSLVADLPAEGLLAVPTAQPTPSPYPTSDPFPPRTLPDQPPNRDVCPGVFSGDTCDECPNAVPLEVVFAAKIVAIVANAVNDSAGTSDQDICVPPGVGFTVPDVIKYIFIGIKAAAEAIVDSLQFANDLNADCEDGFRAALIDLYLDETVSSRVSQASLDAHADLMLRLEIESNLLALADDRVSLFQLPESVCGERVPDDVPAEVTGQEGYLFCGKLELVREIVDDTIARNAAAGMTPELVQAQGELAAGDEHYEDQEYKSAYERYSAAYRYAVMQPAGR